ASRREELTVLVGWLAGERGDVEEAVARLRTIESSPALAGWALAGQALVLIRERRLDEALTLLDRADRLGRPDDKALRATARHLRGTIAHHRGQPGEAL